MIVLKFKKILADGYRAITFAPFVFIREDYLRNDKVLMNHENIHIRQQYETLWLPFFIMYVAEYIYGVYKYKNSRLAYRNISFEREAYDNQYNLNYLKNRKLFSWIKYL